MKIICRFPQRVYASGTSAPSTIRDCCTSLRPFGQFFGCRLKVFEIGLTEARSTGTIALIFDLALSSVDADLVEGHDSFYNVRSFGGFEFVADFAQSVATVSLTSLCVILM